MLVIRVCVEGLVRCASSAFCIVLFAYMCVLLPSFLSHRCVDGCTVCVCRDDVALSSAGQRLQQQSSLASADAASSAAGAATPAAAPATAHPAANMAAAAAAAATGSLGAGMRFSGSLQTDHGRLLQLKVPRSGYVAGGLQVLWCVER